MERCGKGRRFEEKATNEEGMSKEASSGIEAKGELLCMIDSSEMVGGMGNRFFTRHVTLDRQGSSLRLDKYIVYLIALDHDTVVLFLQGVFGRSEERLPVLFLLSSNTVNGLVRVTLYICVTYCSRYGQTMADWVGARKFMFSVTKLKLWREVKGKRPVAKRKVN